VTARPPARIRYEDFGAIIALESPPALVHVDHDLVRELGYPDAERWASPKGWLSAPTEVHVLLTERCPAGCPDCYVDAVMEREDPPTDQWRHTFERLAAQGVFHLALGGGESLLRDDLFDLAAYARDLGMVPNLTTSGIGMTAEKAAACRVFGQVNVSLDGLGDTYVASRGYDGAERALRALRLLADAGVSTGINVVVNRATWAELDATIEAAHDAGAREVELLRFKPAGRAHATYLAKRLGLDERRALVPRVLAWQRRWPDVNVKIDCSFIPFVAAANPPLEALQRFGVIGCEAGNVMAAIRADGTATACSFVEQPLGDVDALVDRWDDHPDLLAWRAQADDPAAPCATCTYRPICRGGCSAVTHHLTGQWDAPDPECPRVVAHARREPFVPVPWRPSAP